MAHTFCHRTSERCTCVAFLHMGNISQLSFDSICSSIVLDSSCQQIINGTLTWFGQSVVNLPVNCSLLCDTVDVNNGCTVSGAEDAAEVACIQQDISNCSVSSCHEDCSVLFATPVRVFLLKMNAHLAGCIAKTVVRSSKFAHSFISYAQHCARKQAVFPVHNVYFNVDNTSAANSFSDIPSPLDTASHDTSTKETTQNVILVHQCVVVVMTFPRRVWIDYQWYGQLLNYLISNLPVKYCLWSPYVIGQTIIFLPSDFYLLLSFFFFLA